MYLHFRSRFDGVSGERVREKPNVIKFSPSVWFPAVSKRERVCVCYDGMAGMIANLPRGRTQTKTCAQHVVGTNSQHTYQKGHKLRNIQSYTTILIPYKVAMSTRQCLTTQVDTATLYHTPHGLPTDVRSVKARRF